MILIRDHPQGASFTIRVHPGAQRTGIVGEYGGSMKVALCAPAVDGRANDALVEFLAGLFHVPRPAVQILGGAHRRNKLVRISGRSASELKLALREHFLV